MENKYRLPREFGEKWLEALRSGDYNQCSNGWMYNDNSYCCLGVACAIEGNDLKNKSADNLGVSSINSIGDIVRVPKELSSNNELQLKLANMNDGEGGEEFHSFEKIADWIQKNIEFYDES